MPALYKESPRPFLSLDELGDPAARTDLATSSTRVLCWVGERIYAQGENSIWTIDQKTKAVQLVLKKTVLGLKTTVSSMRGISIRGDEKKIAFEANDDNDCAPGWHCNPNTALCEPGNGNHGLNRA